jgi:hypothetical protein
MSFIYRHIFIYRIIMNILYAGKYRSRFVKVIDQINDAPENADVLELCFGDVYIADYCRKAGYKWTGLDINMQFVKHAQIAGYNAIYADLQSIEVLPKTDVCIMMGSLYHFHPNAMDMLKKMVEASKVVVISEPVSNLASKKGVIGFIARRAASIGKGNEVFRFDRNSFTEIAETCSRLFNYSIISLQEDGRDMILKLKKNEHD